MSSDDRETAAPDVHTDARAQPRKSWRVWAAALVILLLVPVVMYFVPAMDGFERPTLAALRQCPAAVNLLGSPIERAVGFSYGSAGSDEEIDRAQWDFPVRGALGAGRVELLAVEHNGVWTMLSLRLKVGDRTLDAIRCGAVVTPAMIRAANVSSTVASVTGAAGVAVGDACAIRVSPGRDPFACRVQVRCGATTLYGAGTSGWVRQCSTSASGASDARDPLMSDVDHDPMLDLRGSDGAATITDSTRGGWRVTLAFAPQ